MSETQWHTITYGSGDVQLVHPWQRVTQALDRVLEWENTLTIAVHCTPEKAVHIAEHTNQGRDVIDLAKAQLDYAKRCQAGEIDYWPDCPGLPTMEEQS